MSIVLRMYVTSIGGAAVVLKNARDLKPVPRQHQTGFVHAPEMPGALSGSRVGPGPLPGDRSLRRRAPSTEQQPIGRMPDLRTGGQRASGLLEVSMALADYGVDEGPYPMALSAPPPMNALGGPPVVRPRATRRRDRCRRTSHMSSPSACATPRKPTIPTGHTPNSALSGLTGHAPRGHSGPRPSAPSVVLRSCTRRKEDPAPVR